MYNVKKILIVFFLLAFSFVPVHGVNAESPERMIPADFSALAEKVKPSVVNISTVKKIRGGGRVFRHFFGSPFNDRDFFEEFMEPFMRNQPEKEFEQNSLGSGFIISEDGFIVTNNHVIENADSIKVKLYNEEEYEAEVVGSDPKTDLALIKIEAEDLEPLKLGSSEGLKIGSWVVAVGSPFGLEQTVTAGIVSAKGRVIGAGPYDDFIQTDASINPGNSGGPLLNLDGEVVGINTAIIKSGQGIGFAIPSDLADGIVDQLISSGEVSRGWMGVAIQDITAKLAEYYGIEEKEGVLVAKVYKGHPADDAGIKEGDIIKEVEGEPIKSSRDLSATIASHQVGKKVKVKVVRDGKVKNFQIKLAKRSDMEPGSLAAGEGYDPFGFQFDEITSNNAGKYGLTENASGLIVTDIKQGSKAGNTGIRKGDILKEVNRVRVDDMKDYNKVLDKIGEGEYVRMLFTRSNQRYLVVTLKK